MPQIINTNIGSLTAQRNLNKSQSANQQALQRLSSGLRINSAKDDAAGLAISTRFTSQIRGLNVAIRNAGDGISLAQTAEGALGTMNDNLQRIRELAVQSANATNSDVDRDALQSEVDQLVAEITRTADETDFNGRKLLDGSFDASFQIGANAGQRVNISIAELTANKLGAGTESGISALGTDSAISNGDLLINGIGITASSASDDSASTSGADRSATSKAAAINKVSDQTNVEAVVNQNVAAGSAQTAEATNGAITLNGVRIDITTGGVDTAADRASVLQAINAVSGQTGIRAEDTADDSTGINLVTIDNADGSANGRNIEIFYNKFDANGDAYASGVTASATGLAAGGTGAQTAVATGATITGAATVSATNTLSGHFSLAIDGYEPIVITLNGTGTSMDDVVTSLQSSIDTSITNYGLDGLVGVTVSQSNNIISLTSNLVGEDSSLVLSAVETTVGAGNFVTTGEASIAAILGLTGGIGVLDSAVSDIIFVSEDGSSGAENTEGEFVSAIAFLTTAGANSASTNASLTVANVEFLIEVDGGVAVAVTVAAELAAIDVTTSTTRQTGLDGIAAKYEASINSALTSAGQTGQVDVTFDDGYRLVITSREEGTDSAIRLTNSAANAPSLDLGLVSHTLGATPTNGAVGVAGVENAAQTYEGSLTLRSINGDDINITGGSGDLSASGLESGEFDAGQAYASTESTSVSGAIATSAQVVGERMSLGGLDDTIISGGAFTTAAFPVTFSIEVDGGDLVTVSFQATVADVATLAAYLNSLESDINSTLASDGQTSTVSLSTNADNQLVITSNTVGTGSSLRISAVDTTAAVGTQEQAILGLVNEMSDTGESGAVATQGVLTSVGTSDTTGNQAANGLGTVFSAALADTGGAANTFVAETFRISVDGGEAINVSIANVTVSDATAALTFAEGAINDALTAAGQTAQVTLATNADGFLTISSDKVGAGSSFEVLVTNASVSSTFTHVAGLYAYQKSDIAVDSVSAADGLDSGDLLINGVSIAGAKAGDDTASLDVASALSSSKQASGIATAAAINRSTDVTGVTATVNSTVLNGGAQVATLTTDTPQTGSILINGVETATLTTNGQNGGADDRTAAIDAINAISGQTGVTAIDNGEGINLSAADGRNISVVINNGAKTAADSNGSTAALTGAAIGLNVASADIDNGATFAATAQTSYSSVTLTAAGAIEVSAGQNGASALEAIGLREGSYGASEAGVFIADLDISTVAGAEAALKAVDNAIGAVASQRATLGAIQNRLDSTVNNLSITSNNLSAANSRIRDADFAAETAELSRTQVLQQAGISILAQANAQPQQVLSLLG